MHPFNLSKLAISILFLFVVIIFLTLLTSCSKYTELTATKDVNRAYVNHPKVVAKIARDAFPCIEKKNDTLINYRDSLVYIECPEISTATPIDYLGTDTVVITKSKTVRVPIYMPIKTVTVTKFIEDSAKIMQLNSGLLEAINETAKQKDYGESLEAKIKSKNKYILYFLIAFLLSLLVNYLQFKNKSRQN